MQRPLRFPNCDLTQCLACVNLRPLPDSAFSPGGTKVTIVRVVIVRVCVCVLGGKQPGLGRLRAHFSHCLLGLPPRKSLQLLGFTPLPALRRWVWAVPWLCRTRRGLYMGEGRGTGAEPERSRSGAGAPAAAAGRESPGSAPGLGSCVVIRSLIYGDVRKRDDIGAVGGGAAV